MQTEWVYIVLGTINNDTWQWHYINKIKLGIDIVTSNTMYTPIKTKFSRILNNEVSVIAQHCHFIVGWNNLLKHFEKYTVLPGRLTLDSE